MILLDKNFLFINTGDHSGAWNMQYDVQQALAMQTNDARPSLRVYGWKPWCISLGKNQVIEDIDVDRAYNDGIDVVHRPTGGRAILHAEELTYSVIMPLGKKGPTETYKLIGDALASGLQNLAPGVTQVKSQLDFQRLYNEPNSIPCFSSSARYEIECDGKKLVGSAQRVFGTNGNDNAQVILQHGSILLGNAQLRLTDYLNVDDRTKEVLHHDLVEHTVTMSEICKRTVTFDEVALAIRRGFEDAWDIEFDEEDEPDRYLIEEAVAGLK